MRTAKRGTGESHRTEAQVRQEVAAQVRQEVVAQVRQELANLHDQALKENENLLKEKETRIQVSIPSEYLKNWLIFIITSASEYIVLICLLLLDIGENT